MKRVFSLVLGFIFVCFGILPAYAAFSNTPPVCASAAYVVMDKATGQVFVEKGMNEKMYPASLTKVMTAILALENLDMKAMHTMSYEATHSIDANSTHIALTQDEVISVEDLMYAMMVESANDAANGLAECVAGTMDAFVEMMNQKAKEIGAVNTHFANANGLHDDNHYTTAYDLALITRYALGVEGFYTYFNAPDHTIQPTNKQPKERYFGTDHMMLVTSAYEYDGATGGKLGYTNDARHTSITTAKRGELELIVVTLKSDKFEKFEDATKLFDYCFDSFGQVALSKKDLQGFVIPVYEGTIKTRQVQIYPDNQISVWLHKSVDVSSLKLDYQVPQSYLNGDEIAPKLHITVQGDISCMYRDLGLYPLQFETVEAGVTLDPNTGLPVKDTSAFWRGVLTFLKWAGIVLGALVVLFFALVAVARIRGAMRKKKRARRQARPVSATAVPTERKGPVHFYVEPDKTHSGPPKSRRR